LILVRNDFTHDSRVLREAKTLARMGYRPEVVAVVSEVERSERSSEQGIPIRRLDPTSPFAWLRARLRRAPRATSGGAAESSAGDGGATIPDRAGRQWVPLVRLHRWIRTLDFYRRGIAIVRAERPALVHCNDYNTMWIGAAARLIGGSAVVYDAHELWPDRNLRPEPRWWLLACEGLFVRLAHRTITASPGYAEIMARRYRIAPPTVIRNIPERPQAPIAPPPSGSGRPEEAPVALYAGALTRNRGLEVAIRALAAVPSVRLRLLGPVSHLYRQQLEALAEREGVSERVEFSGAIPSEEVVGAIGEASVGLALIQPACLSYRMSLPNKLFEYVLAGVPVLASDLPVIGAFVSEHGIGLVAGPDNPDEIAARLGEMLRPERNRELRLAVRTAAEGMRWENEEPRLAAAYGDATRAWHSRRSRRLLG